MKVLHLAASLPSHAINAPRINPLRVVQDFEHKEDEQEQHNREEQEQFIKDHFESFFTAFEKMYKIAEKALTVLEENEGNTNNVQRFGSALEALENLSPINVKKAKYYLTHAIDRMPTTVIDDIFCEVCENPCLTLECDFLS